MRYNAGFTLVELVTTMLLIGILAAVAIPRMDTGVYRELAFRDQALSALRFAQKTATSHRRLVCVKFEASSVTLTIATVNGATACNTALPLPGGAASVQSSDPANAVFKPVPGAPVPADLFFQPDGRATSDGAGTSVVAKTLTIGEQSITLVGASGHVQ